MLFQASLFLFLLSYLQFADSKPVLKQIHVVTRHGARTRLNKDGNTLLETAGSTLTPTGQKQLYDLGVWLRQTYNIDGFLEYYDPAEVRLESSDLDRTLTSANALSRGLFPLNAQAAEHGLELFNSLLPGGMPSIPVYSHSAQNDIYQRAYHRNCPKFHDNMDAMFESSAWRTLEEANWEFLGSIARHFPDEANEDDGSKFQNGRIKLQHLWNFYDAINVAREECIGQPFAYSCQVQGVEALELANNVDDEEFSRLETLMGESEKLKFGVETAGNLLGSRLLWKMLDRINDNQDSKFFLYSAHAPTLMGLLSTLQEWQDIEPHPKYGSAIIMEVYRDDETLDHTLRFVYRSGESNKTEFINVKNAVCNTSRHAESVPAATLDGLLDDQSTHCEYTSFLQWAIDHTLISDLDWCQACENKSADVCLRERADEILAGHENLLDEMEEQLLKDGSQPLLVASFFLLGFFSACILLLLVNCVSRHQTTQTREDPTEFSHTSTVSTIKPTFDSPMDDDENNQDVFLT